MHQPCSSRSSECVAVPSGRRSGRGFTLIELLVVVGVIAILLAILLPAMAAAREQGKTAVCLANQRSIVQGANAYLLDHHREDLPWALPKNYSTSDGVFTWTCYSEYIWGGGMPDKTLADWKGSGATGIPDPTGCDVYRVPPKHRPMNRYLGASVSWTLAGETPGFFRCPSDSSASVPLAGGNNHDRNPDGRSQTWAFWGTSYAINWYWPYYHWYYRLTKGTRVGKNPPYSKNLLTMLGTSKQVPGLGASLLAEKGQRWTSSFIIFFENRLNYALEGAAPRGAENPGAKLYRGWHKKLDYHVAGFLDGHAVHARFDTRFVDGPGWTTWPSRPWSDDWEEYNDD